VSNDHLAFAYGANEACDPCDRFSSDGTYALYDFRSDDERRLTRDLDVHLNGQFATGTLRHDLTAGVLDSDLVIDGPGRNAAFGHVVLHLQTLTGVVTLSGGTGRFAHFHAGPLTVACPKFPDCSWDGPYSFTSHDDD